MGLNLKNNLALGRLPPMAPAGDGLGPELVPNGSFDDATGWTLGAGWSISGGELISAASTGDADFAVTTENGKTYRVKYTVTEYTAGGVRFRFTGTANVNGGFSNSADPFQEDILATSNNSIFRLVSGGTPFQGRIDNLSVREVL